MQKQYEVIESFRGAPEGHTVIEYEKGQVVPLSGDFAAQMERAGKVRPAGGKKKGGGKGNAGATESTTDAADE